MQTLLQGLRAARPYARLDWLWTFAVVFGGLGALDCGGWL